MKKKTGKIIAIIFIIVGFVFTLCNSIYNGVYADEYNIVYDWHSIIYSFYYEYWDVLGIGLIMFILSSIFGKD